MSVIRFVTDPVSGAITVFNFPQDIYDNTRLAYATDETLAELLRARHGAERSAGDADGRRHATGTSRRRAARAATSSTRAIAARRTSDFLGRWFGEMDFRLAKAFQLPGRARFEFSAEIFNATKALNFPNTINPGSELECVPHDVHAERRPHGAARVARELVVLPIA